jgi:glycosyltransferase involved in cell wall biosynthesis
LKLLLIVDDYLPESTKIAAKMMHELALEFKNQGHDVYIITPDSYKKYSHLLIHIEILDGITILRFPSGKLKNISKPIRLINEFLLPYLAWFHGRKLFKTWNIDFIVYYSPSIFWGHLVRKFKKLWKAKSYLILRDIFPQWAIDNGLLPKKSLITKFFEYFEKTNYNSADTIGLMSENNLIWFRDNNKGDYKTEVLYNWVSDIPVNLIDKPYREKFKIQDKVVFFYGGNIGHAQDMSQILRLAKNLLNHKEAFFILVGSGDEVDLVRHYINTESLTNVILLDPVPQEEFVKLMAEFDVGLFSLNKNHTTHNFPGKTLGYMVQGMPILGCVNPGNDLKDVINTAEAGLVVDADDDEALKKAAIQLLDNNRRSQMSKNSKNLLYQKFSVSNAYNTILTNIR